MRGRALNHHLPGQVDRRAIQVPVRPCGIDEQIRGIVNHDHHVGPEIPQVGIRVGDHGCLVHVHVLLQDNDPVPPRGPACPQLNHAVA
eukprot:15150711-Alexandrium_andersonii.AAC.1